MREWEWEREAACDSFSMQRRHRRRYLGQWTLWLLSFLRWNFIFSHRFQLNIDKTFILDNVRVFIWWTAQAQSSWFLDRSLLLFNFLCMFFVCCRSVYRLVAIGDNLDAKDVDWFIILFQIFFWIHTDWKGRCICKIYAHIIHINENKNI